MVHGKSSVPPVKLGKQEGKRLWEGLEEVVGEGRFGTTVYGGDLK